MDTAVGCTLFESHYHFGVAALVNSLYQNGFRGDFYAGFRGEIPSWVLAATKSTAMADWPGSCSVNVASGLTLHFLPVNTNYHLTNFKPNFMLQLLNGVAKGKSGMFYFDPDIVVSAPWSFFEDWINCGVALCEDVNSPLLENHPIRVGWRRYFQPYNFTLTFKTPIYVNGGFAGVSAKDIGFLERWKGIQDAMAFAIGGLERSAFPKGDQLTAEFQGPFALFGKTDQDALNATLETWPGLLSILTQEAMGFRTGLTIMPHALGQPKPWNWNPVRQILAGKTPRLVDRHYWQYSDAPLSAHPLYVIKYRRVALRVAAFISRFYKR